MVFIFIFLMKNKQWKHFSIKWQLRKFEVNTWLIGNMVYFTDTILTLTDYLYYLEQLVIFFLRYKKNIRCHYLLLHLCTKDSGNKCENANILSTWSFILLLVQDRRLNSYASINIAYLTSPINNELPSSFKSVMFYKHCIWVH